MKGIAELVERMLRGDKKALARLITYVEEGSEATYEILEAVHPHAGRAFIVGVTGIPGAGKSTIVDGLTKIARERDLRVGIIAADPSSPFTHGALLGDRIRMQRHFLDEGVFIRSMATRGSRGGLPLAAGAVAKLLDAFGKDLIFLETVGVGQTELDVMEMADSVVVVLVPESGDAIQTMKAGLLEIADIFIINKADRGGAETLALQLRESLRLSPARNEWEIPIIITRAAEGKGLEEVFEALERHRKFLLNSGEMERRRRERREFEFSQALENELRRTLIAKAERDLELSSYLEKVLRGEVDPHVAAHKILAGHCLLRGGGG